MRAKNIKYTCMCLIFIKKLRKDSPEFLGIVIWSGWGGELRRVNGATGRSEVAQNMAFSEYFYLEPCKYSLLKK